MARKFKNAIPTDVGLANAGAASRYVHLGSPELADYGFYEGSIAESFECVSMGRIDPTGSMPNLSGSTTATSGVWTGTYTSGGTAGPGNDGYTLTTAGSNTNLFVLAHSRRLVATVLNKLTLFKALFQQVAVVTSNLVMGITNSTTNPFTTPPTNGVYFTVTNGAVVGNVVGAGGSVASTGTLGTLVAGTLSEIDFKFINTGQVAASGTGNNYVPASSGEWWFKQTTTSTPVVTPLTAAQLAALVTMTGNLYHIEAVQTSANSAASVTLDAVRVEYDR